jgi:hypothetical protein
MFQWAQVLAMKGRASGLIRGEFTIESRGATGQWLNEEEALFVIYKQEHQQTRECRGSRANARRGLLSHFHLSNIQSHEGVKDSSGPTIPESI